MPATVETRLPLRVRVGHHSRRLIGTVTKFRRWDPTPAEREKKKDEMNWLFNLCLTDKRWRPLKDRMGYLYPIVEVEYRSDVLHGPPLEYGSRVVMRGKTRKDRRFRASEIWNCSIAHEQTYWGRVVNLRRQSIVDDERPIEVWAFQLQQTDPQFERLARDRDGNPLEGLHVEIRAESISGPLEDGHKVEVSGEMARGALHAHEICNHSARGATLVLREWAGVP